MPKKKRSDEWLAHDVREAAEVLAIAISDAWQAGLSVDPPETWKIEWESNKRLCVSPDIKITRRL